MIDLRYQITNTEYMYAVHWDCPRRVMYGDRGSRQGQRIGHSSKPPTLLHLTYSFAIATRNKHSFHKLVLNILIFSQTRKFAVFYDMFPGAFSDFGTFSARYRFPPACARNSQKKGSDFD